ncbi:MAG: ECF-type sigma factor [Planctomycetes bacterium]|nr:ECF-type sigma factor [Planctomycetota bacterium]
MSFATTRWSQVVCAGGQGAEARAALAWLCQAYWQPLAAHARRRGLGEHSAEDLVQEVLLSLVAGGSVAHADPARGRFRTFLLACVEHHLGHRRERAQAQKRGGGQAAVALEEGHAAVEPDPARTFEREWAQALLQRAREALAREQAGQGQAGRFAALERFLAENGDARLYRDVGQALGLEAGAVRVAVHRLRGRYRELLRAEVADTLESADPAAIDRELDDLLAALVDGR